MSTFEYECRLCLRKIEENEKMAFIDEEIKNQFTNITQMQLELNVNFSEIICELCLRSLQLANALKTQFIANQRKLYYTLSSQLKITEVTHFSPETSHEPTPKKHKITDNVQSSDKNTNLQQEFENNDDELTLSQPVLNIKEEKPDGYFEQHEMHEPHQYYPNITKLNEIKTEEKPFIGQMLLNSSQNMHTSSALVPEKSFECSFCPKKYRRRDHMSRHIKEDHKGIKFKCVVPGCSIIYRRKEKLKNHVLTKHKTELNETDLASMLELVKTATPFYESCM